MSGRWSAQTSAGARLAVIGGLASFGPLSLDLYLPGLPQVGAALHAGEGVTQLSVSGCLVGLAVGQFVFGPLGDRFGRRRPLLAGVGLWTVASLLCAAAPDAAALVALRVLMGLGGAAGLVLSRAVVRDLYDDAALARAVAVVALMTNVAPAIAPVTGGGLLQFMSWRGLFLVLGAIGVLLWAGVLLVLPESLPAARRHRAGVRDTLTVTRGLISERRFRSAAGAFALVSAMLFTYISLSSFVLQHHEGLSPAGFSLIFAANSVGIIVVGALTVRWSSSWLPGQLLEWGAGVGSLSCLALVGLAVTGAPSWALLAALWCAISSIGATLPSATTLALMHAADRAGAGSALLGGTQYLAGAIAGPIVTLGGQSPQAMAIGMAGFAALALGVALLGGRGEC